MAIRSNGSIWRKILFLIIFCASWRSMERTTCQQSITSSQRGQFIASSLSWRMKFERNRLLGKQCRPGERSIFQEARSMAEIHNGKIGKGKRWEISAASRSAFEAIWDPWETVGWRICRPFLGMRFLHGPAKFGFKEEVPEKLARYQCLQGHFDASQTKNDEYGLWVLRRGTRSSHVDNYGEKQKETIICGVRCIVYLVIVLRCPALIMSCWCTCVRA